MSSYSISPSFKQEIQDTTRGKIPIFDNESVNDSLVEWEKMSKLFDEMRNAGNLFLNKNVSGFGHIFSFDLDVNNQEPKHHGAILSSDGSVHFVPYNTNYGWKINTNPNNNFAVQTTYSFLNTQPSGQRFLGGTLARNGDIYFVPGSSFQNAQKVNASGVVSSYGLAYTSSSSFLYDGAVLSPSGDIHFVPRNANVGHMISKNGVSSTYTLLYTTVGAYRGGVLAPDGSIHFVPFNAIKPGSRSGFSAIPLGQKVTVEGIVRTYEFPRTNFTTSQFFIGGVLSSDGTIHFIPYTGDGTAKGFKYDVYTDSIITYSLPISSLMSFIHGGVLGPDGNIYVPGGGSSKGLKIYSDRSTTVVTTYDSKLADHSYGGVLAPNGTIYFSPSQTRGIKIEINSSFTPSLGMCMSPFLNKT